MGMKKNQWYIGAPNGVVLCVDRMELGRMVGTFYHAYQREGTVFRTVDELLFELEHFYNWINFPRQSTNDRTFSDDTSYVAASREERIKVMTDEELLKKHGDLGSFVIRVQHRQNSSWQGRITWMDEDKTVNFRSIWEMIKLIDDALNTASGPEDGLEDVSWPEL